MQEKHPIISSDEQLALGGMQNFLKVKTSNYAALNHTAVLPYHTFKI